MFPGRCERCGGDDSPEHVCAGAETAVSPRGGHTQTAPDRPSPSVPPSASGPEPRRGDLLAGRYELVEKVGEGGGGMVFRAKDRELDVVVALKVLRPGPSIETLLRRLKREIRITRDIDHPNVSRVFDLSESRGLTFFTMRWIDGEPLHRRVQKSGPLEGPALRRLARGLVSALAAAHRLGVVHRDVKPANVLVSASGEPVLVDFGIATDEGASPDAHVRRGEPITLSGRIPGTPAFMPPEQLEGKATPPATDLWSLALTLAFAVQGKIERPESPRRTFAPFGAPLAGLLVRCLEMDPDRRPRDAVVLEDAMVRAESRRRLRRTSAAWTAVLLLVALGGVFATRRAARETTERGPPTVRIDPIENASRDPEAEWLVRGVADLLRSGIESSGRARLATDDRSAHVARIGGRVLSPGEVELVLSAPSRGLRDRVRFRTEGESLFRGVESATDRFLAALGAAPARRSKSGSPPAVALTRSHEALAHYERGLALVRAHKGREALDELRAAVARDGGFAAAHLHRYVLAMGGHGTVAEADTALERATALPERLSATERELLVALRAARARGVDTAPLRRLRAFLRSHPPDASVYFLASTIPNVDRAERRAMLEEWAARIPSDPEPHNRLGYVLMEDFDDPAGAGREFRAYLRLAPNDANAHDSYADFLARERRFDEAIREYDRALAIDPTFVNAAIDAADVFLARGDLAAASSRLAQVRPLVVDFREVHMWVELSGAVRLLADDVPGALRFLDEVARDPAFGTRAYLALEYEAVVLARSGETARARQAAEEAVRLSRRFHGDETVLASLPPYVEALAAHRRGDRGALDRAAAALTALGTSLDVKLPDRRRLVDALGSVHRDPPALAAERLLEASDSTRTGTGFVASFERSRALVRAGRLPEASTAFAEAEALAMHDLRTPEVASALRDCLAEAAAVERSLGRADAAATLDARLAALARTRPR